MKEFKDLDIKLRPEIEYSKEDAEIIYNIAVNVAREHIEIHNIRAIYIIGSYATGAFSPKRSDCDLIAFYDGDKVLFEEKTIPVELQNGKIKRDMAFSMCTRPFSYLKDYWNILMCRLNQGVIWKEINAIEDYMMIHNHGILIEGEDIRESIPNLTVKQYFDYIKLRSQIIVNIGEHDKMGVYGLAKAVIANTRDAIFLWTGHYCYETYVCLKCLKELKDFPNEAIDIFEETVKTMDVDWDNIISAENIEIQLVKYLRKCKKYFIYLQNFEKCSLSLKYPCIGEVFSMYAFIPYHLPTIVFNKEIQVSLKEENVENVVVNNE